MLDTFMRPVINPPLDAIARRLVAMGVSANAVTVVGLVLGLGAAGSIAFGAFKAGVVLIAANRLFDGLDGAVARATARTDSGGYLDIVADYAFYGSVPFGFALADPAQNALPAAGLLAAFCVTAASFLSYAIIAASRGLETSAHGKKSFFYSSGIVEGTETVLFFLVMAIFPSWFAELAWLFAGLCVLTAVQRSVAAFRAFGPNTDSGESP